MFAESGTLKPLYAGKIVVDSNVSTSTIMTTASLAIDPGDPAVLDGFTTGIQFRFAGGTWNLPVLNENTTISQLQQAYYQASPQPDGLKAPLTIVGASNYYLVEIEPDPPVITNQLPDTLQDWKLISDFATSQTIPEAWVYRMHPELGLQTATGSAYGDSAAVNGNLVVDIDALVDGNLTVGANIRSYDGSIVALTEGGSFSTPQVQTISTLPGGIAGDYVGADIDLHVGDGAYVNNTLVVGAGAQAFGPVGQFILSSDGTGTTPTAGSARMWARTSTRGVNFELFRSVAPNRGSVENVFGFDSDLRTSTTIDIGDGVSGYEGQATILSGATTTTVATSQVWSTDTPGLAYPGSSNGGGAPWVQSITSGTAFAINCTAAVTTDTVVNWKIYH